MWSSETESYYTKATIYLPVGVKGKRTIYLHQIIFDLKEGEYTDHRTHETLDNRESNLKITTNAENALNRIGANKNNKTGYRNVSYISSKNVYRVQLQINGKNTNFGDFKKLDDAVKCAKINREKHYKGIDNINII